MTTLAGGLLDSADDLLGGLTGGLLGGLSDGLLSDQVQPMADLSTEDTSFV